MVSSSDIYRAIRDRDPWLLTALRAGETGAHRGVARLLTVTRLEVLKRDADHLVDVVAACPELHEGIRHAWTAQDPRFTAQFLSTVGRRTPRAA